MKKTGNAMIIPEETFSQSKMKYPITSLIVYQLIFYTCENQNENLSCISSKQLSCHPQKVRPPVHSFHQHQYAVVEGIEVVELS